MQDTVYRNKRDIHANRTLVLLHGPQDTLVGFGSHEEEEEEEQQDSPYLKHHRDQGDQGPSHEPRGHKSIHTAAYRRRLAFTT